MNVLDFSSTPLEQLLEIAINRRKVTIGLPAPHTAYDRRFPLTPEACGQLAQRGFQVKMETGAPQAIHYSDLRYQQQSVEIVERAEALRCDIVICLSPLDTIDARTIKRGALLLTLYPSAIDNGQALAILLRNHVISLALDLIVDEQGHHPFADILAEISGRAAMAIASSLLADAEHGKGILLGGVAGIVPCEVVILGSGIDACAAARSALGLGALVRMFDNDVYRLRNAIRELGSGVIGSAMHPRVLLNALRTADVVVGTDINPHYQIAADAVAEMKLGVVVIDLGHPSLFPSLRCVDLGHKSTAEGMQQGQRPCYVNPGNAVPRTAAMALSNTFLTMITEIFTCDGLTNALMLNEGLQRAALTFLGKPVHPAVAAMMGLRLVDIKLLLQFS